MRIDEFYYKQPEPKYIEWLNSPMHESAPERFGRTEAGEGEISALGAYMADNIWETLLWVAVSAVCIASTVIAVLWTIRRKGGRA